MVAAVVERIVLVDLVWDHNPAVGLVPVHLVEEGVHSPAGLVLVQARWRQDRHYRSSVVAVEEPVVLSVEPLLLHGGFGKALS